MLIAVRGGMQPPTSASSANRLEYPSGIGNAITNAYSSQKHQSATMKFAAIAFFQSIVVVVEDLLCDR